MTITGSVSTQKPTVHPSALSSLDAFEIIHAHSGNDNWFKYIAIAALYAKEHLLENNPNNVSITCSEFHKCDRPWKLITASELELWSFPTAINAACALFALKLHNLEKIDIPIDSDDLYILNEIFGTFDDRTFEISEKLLELAIQWDYDNIPF